MSKSEDPAIEEVGGNNDALEVVEEPKRSWKSYIWDSLDKSPEERRFLFKLDVALLLIACLGYFIKYLDQANLNNAFVSGMKEDLGMYGNQLNYAITTWTCGYLAGEIPSNILLTRIRPSIWLPACEIVWSVLTMAMSRCNNVTQLYVLRFFIGLAEAGFYPGVVYVMGSWYRNDELAKRVSLFNISGGVATMFSGYLMTAVINLNGTNGLKGWQWLFIMDGVISLPVAIAGFFIYPDFPHNSRAWYLKEHDKAIARTRTLLDHRPRRQPYTTAKILKIFKSWRIYLLPLLFLFAGAAAAGTAQPIFAIYLKASKNPIYTLSQINNYPTIASAFGIVTTLVYAWLSDGVLKGRRWPVLLVACILNFIVFTSLAVWNISEGWRWACYIIAGQVSSISPISLAWGSELCRDDEEERAIVVAAMNDSVYVIGIWLTLIIWQQVDGPQYHKGFITASVWSAAAVITTLLVRWLAKRDLSRKAAAAQQVEPEIQSEQSQGP